jgi:predicted nucleotidyltransferase
MIKKSTIEQVLEYFFTYPTTRVHLRELARQLHLSMPTIITATSKLAQEKLITIERTRALTIVRATHTKQFTRRKRISNLAQLYESGLIDALDRMCTPDAIICFGSYSRGEDAETSDIDIALINSNGRDVPVEEFEHLMRRKISIHAIDTHMSKEFMDNLKNGIVLEGAL